MNLRNNVIVGGCILALLLPSVFSSLVWGPMNPVIHTIAIVLFILVCKHLPNAAFFVLPVVALFLSFLPYFDWLQYSDSFRGAHFPRLDMIKAQFQGHLFSFVWSFIFLLVLKFYGFRSMSG